MNIYVLTALFILLDFVTGIFKAFYKKEFKSSIMREGLFHKVAEVIVIVLGVLVEYAAQYAHLELNGAASIAICVYIIFMEIGSVVENAGEINPDLVHEKVRACFVKLKDK